MLTYIILIGLIGITVAIYYELKIRSTNRLYVNNKGKQIPSVYSDPIWSTLKGFYNAFDSRSQNETFYELCIDRERNNTDKVILNQFFGFTFLFTWNHKMINQILKDTETWAKLKGLSSIFDDLFDKSLGFVEGNEWKVQRKLLTPPFHAKFIRRLDKPFNIVSGKLVEKMKIKAAESGSFIAHDMLSKMTLDTLGLAAFGFEFNTLDGEMSKVFEAYSMIIGEFTNPLRMINIYNKLPIRNNQKFSESVKIFHKWTMETVEKKIDVISKRGVNNESDDIHEDNSDLLDLMVETYLRGEWTLKHLQTNMLLFFLAGFETTSTTLTFLLIALAEHRDVQQKCRDEVKKIIEASGGDSNDKDAFISYDMAQSFKYIPNVVKETMRVHSAISGLVRRSTKDTYLDGYFIPAGTRVLMASSAMHTDPDNFGPDASVFNPDRWNNKEKMPNPNAMTYFGAGPRICIGNKFSLLETSICLSKILINFNIIQLEKSVKAPRAFVLKPQKGYKIGLEQL